MLEGPSGPVAGRAAHKRRVALLAILALARGRPVGRERLIGLLWPDQPSDSARHSLSESLYVLRKELGEDALVSTGDEVSLTAGVVASDVAGFEEALAAGEAEAAVRAYGGPFLAGFYVADSAEFERWAEGERDRLARAYARAVEELACAAEGAGEPLRAVEWWRRLAAHDPYSSRVALRLVHALDAAGERAAALRFAETHAALLREELGLETDPELAAFVERLRAEPPRAPAPPPPPPRLPAPPLAPSPASAVTTAAEADGDREDVGGSEIGGSKVGRSEAGRSGEGGSEVERMAAPDLALAAAVADAPVAAAASRPIPVAAPVPVPVATPAPTAAPGRRRREPRAAAYLGAVAGLVLGLALAFLTVRGTERTERAEEGPRYDPRRIAVLYFDDYSRGGELGYLANGLTEMLIHELSQVEALDVVSRNGVKAYRDGAVPFDSMVADLRAGSIVEGSLQRSGDSVRVTVQLIDANTQAHLESRIVVRPMGDVFALESALAQEVSGFLRRRLGEAVRLGETEAETRSDEARALVLQAEQARDDAARVGGEQAHPLDAASAARLLARADSLLARAEAADPRWARPTVLRGWVAADLARLEGDARAPAAFGAAAAHAARVLAREPGNARALELRGVATWRAVAASAGRPGQAERLDGAERDLRAAVAAEPSLASAWSSLSQLLLYRGRFAEAELAARRALAEDAFLSDADDVLHRLLGGAMMLGDYDKAEELCAQGRRQFAGDWRFVECRLTLLRENQALSPDPALAWALVAELDRMDPPARARAEGRGYTPLYRRMVAAAISARAGQADSARAVIARARAEAAGDPALRVSLAYDEAYVRLRLGEREAARRLLDEYVAARPTLRSFIARDPLFRELCTPAPPGGPPRVP